LPGQQRAEFFVLGKPVGFEFGEDSGFVQEDLEAAVGEGLQLQPRNALLELFQNLLRQTGGMTLVFSASAILDADLHGFINSSSIRE
jgi:hypothetical protein